MKAHLVDVQRAGDGCERGSWDPGPLDATGGRVAVTALHLLSEEIFYRYPRVAGLRTSER